MVLQPLKDQNHLFRSTPDAEWKRILPYIERVDLTVGMVLSSSNMKLSYVYFPTTALISILHDLNDGTSAEVAVIGNEGLVGVSVFMGSESSSSVAMVKIAGVSYRIQSSLVLNEFTQSGPLKRLILRFTQALITQMTQTAVCNRHHLVEQQLCRLLLISRDRLPSDELAITQELIAHLLGVRREGITEAALKIQADGLIKYTRGHITILDRAGLERRSCECYQVVKKEYARLLPDRVAT